MDIKKRPLRNKYVLSNFLGQTQKLLHQNSHLKSTKTTTTTKRKFLSVQQHKLNDKIKRNFSKLQNQETLLEWAEMKMDDGLIHTCSPFSYKSLTNKHFYNQNKKLQNLNEVYEVFRQLFDSQSFELKNQLNQFLSIKEDLIKKYQIYQSKLKRLLQLQEKVRERKVMQKNSKLFNSSQQMSKHTQKSQGDLQPKVKLCEQISDQKKEQNIDKKQLDKSEKNLQLSSVQQKSNISLQIQNKIHNAGDKQQSPSKKLKVETLKNLKTSIENKRGQIESLKQKIQKAKQVKQNAQQQRDNKKRQIQKCLNQIKQLNLKRTQIEDQNQKLNHQLQKQNQKYQNQKLRFRKNLLTAYLIKLPLDHLQNEKKRLNDELQQMRGNIRVYCRIRPLCKDQKQMNYELKSHDLLVIKKSFQNRKSQNMKTDFQFVFDRIFNQATTQEQVFGEISQLVQSAIDGKNVCIFAYGQTGSGKTFTMQGKKQPQQAAGVIPRSIQLIFQQLQKNTKSNTKNTIAVSINQIYNDTLVNLLTKSNLTNGKPIFTNVTSIKQVQDQLHKAVSNRSTAFTLSNADSSRSHLIFVIKITQKKVQITSQKERQNIKQSHLILVDLAGSQRVKQSGVSNQRLKEAQHINNSLSQLGQVIRSLKSNKTKTNFRNSKLTFFLQPYLQKGSKAVMFVNISPSAFDESQTINSLKFASIARQCRLQQSQ